jgi:predicted peptidase
MKALVVFLFIFPLIFQMKAQDQSFYEKKEMIVDNDTLRYRILYPENFDPQKKYPLVLFLHGSGERGKDNSAQLVHGSKMFVDPKNHSQFPAIVIFPQCPKDSYWAKIVRGIDPNNANSFLFDPYGEPTKPMMLTILLIKKTLKEKHIDKNRVYVGGLSMGGMGTFEILHRCPKTFAAAFPICGGGNPESVRKYAKKVKIWVFHGALDNVVLPKYSEEMVNALKRKKGDVKFTVYPEANHNSWDSAFAEPTLLPWLFSIIKK